MASQLAGNDKDIEIFKTKKIVQCLESAKGNGTSMISLVIPPKEKISKIAKMLANESSTADNIKSKVNRLSVQGAITSVQNKLKLYNKVPDNGLMIYCGTIITSEGKEKMLCIDFVPFKPFNTSLYLCDNKFHTKALSDLLEDDSKFGFIIIDGNGALFGSVCGNAREVLHKFSVDLPKKHGRGGQSALRFARLRTEKRHNYLKKVAEQATALFITNDKVNVAGLVLAGSADFKSELSESDLLDDRLQSKLLATVDVSYGGLSGFNQAIDICQDLLKDVKLVMEKKEILEFFKQIAADQEKCCYGIEHSMRCLESGIVETLIIWENLECSRLVLKKQGFNEETILLLTPEQEKQRSDFIDKETNTELEVVEKTPLVDWLAANYQPFRSKIVFVTNKTQEGSQFCKAFAGIGGILRYKIDQPNVDMDENDDSSSNEEGEY